MNGKATRLLLAFGILMVAAAARAAHPVAAQSVPDNRAQPQVTVNDVNPWTHLRLNNDPDNFQFAIVADRTGGHAPGVFPSAMRKLNLLQPEFVMSVGDLIEGYTRDRARLETEWDEMEGFIDTLEMPFFYVPGNHEINNPLSVEVWAERFGRSYYHFVYRDVLFLCLNTEDAGYGRISEAQQAYVADALAANPDVRWTLVFMHAPLWNYTDEETGALRDTGWPNVEAMLENRPHTVFAGHHHVYTKHERHGYDYIMLGTTAVGRERVRPLRGTFDHVVWVTMTEDGPQIANLMLEGIWDRNIRTARVASLVDPLYEGAVTIAPILSTTRLFEGGATTLQLTNDANAPLEVTASLAAHQLVALEPQSVTVVVAPNSTGRVDFRVQALVPWPVEQLRPPTLNVSAKYQQHEVELGAIEQEIPLLVTRARFLTTGGNRYEHWPSFSPDGNSVLFTRTINGQNWDLFVVPPAGGAAQMLFRPPPGTTARTASWSRAGDAIAFTGVSSDGKRSVWLINRDGTEARNLAPPGLSEDGLLASWYPKGDYLAVSDFGDNVVKRIHSVQAEEAVPLTDRNQVIAGNSTVSADGRWLAFAGQRVPAAEPLDYTNNSILVVGIDGTCPTSWSECPLEVSGGQGQGPAWSPVMPDGQWLAFQSIRSSSYGYALFIVKVTDADGNVIMDENERGLRQVTSYMLDAQAASWSPDGTQLVFSAIQNPNGGPRAIAVIDIER